MPALVKQPGQIGLAIPPGATTTQTSPDFVNNGASGVAVIVNVTVNAGLAGTVTIAIQGKDIVSGTYYTILQSAALSALALTRLRVAPLLVPAANLTVNDALPERWRIVCTSNGSPMTYTVGACYLP